LKAIILAAGMGDRLRPLTNNKPKCMVELFGKSIIERQIEIFRSCQIDEIIVITGYQSQLINLKNVTYYSNPKFKTTNMVETLFCAKEKLTDSVIISYGDIIFEKYILEKLIASQEDFSIVVDKNWEKYWKMRFENPLDDAESLVLDKDNFITDIGKKVENLSDICGQYIGLMKFQNLGLISLNEFYKKTKEKAKNGINPLNPDLPFERSYMTDFLRGLISENYKLKSIMIENGWLEVDTINDYNLYHELYQNNLLSDLIKIDE
jgi:choline kinase